MAERALLAADFSKNKNHYFPGEAIVIIEDLSTSFTSVPSRTIYTEAGVEFGSNIEFKTAQQHKLATGVMFTLRRDANTATFTLTFTTREVYDATWTLAQGGKYDDDASLGSMVGGTQITMDGTLPPLFQFRIIMQQPDTLKYIIVTIPQGRSVDIANLTKDDYINIPCTIEAEIDPEDTTTYPTVYFEATGID